MSPHRCDVNCHDDDCPGGGDNDSVLMTVKIFSHFVISTSLMAGCDTEFTVVTEMTSTDAISDAM